MKTIKIEHPVITIPVSVIVREVDSSLPEYKDLFPGMPEPFKDVIIKEGIPFEHIDLSVMWGNVMTKDDVEMLKSLCEIKSQLDEIPWISDMEVKSRLSYLQKINEMINELESDKKKGKKL